MSQWPTRSPRRGGAVSWRERAGEREAAIRNDPTIANGERTAPSAAGTRKGGLPFNVDMTDDVVKLIYEF